MSYYDLPPSLAPTYSEECVFTHYMCILLLSHRASVCCIVSSSVSQCTVACCSVLCRFSWYSCLSTLSISLSRSLYPPLRWLRLYRVCIWVSTKSRDFRDKGSVSHLPVRSFSPLSLRLSLSLCRIPYMLFFPSDPCILFETLNYFTNY